MINVYDNKHNFTVIALRSDYTCIEAAIVFLISPFHSIKPIVVGKLFMSSIYYGDQVTTT